MRDILHERAKALARHVARGGTVVGWAKRHDVPARTAYAWSAKPAFRIEVDRHRAACVDRAAGALSARAKRAVDTIAGLADGSPNDGVRLSAARAILEQLTAVASLAELERRIVALEAGRPKGGGDEQSS